MSIPPEIHFWRDYQGHELDFVIEGEKIHGVEITTGDHLRKSDFTVSIFISSLVIVM